MTREGAQRYAEDWAACWNRLDLEAVLAHFDDDVVFTSPKAVVAVGMPTVRGKQALRDYWTTALSAIGSLRFRVHRIMWDPTAHELSIVYDRDIDGRHDRAAEVLEFGEDGKVVRAEVLYGVVPK